jgi:photosystem II stability/assembly factor-like uncharacterized protein
VLDVAMVDSVLVAVVQECGIFRSLDDGASWNRATPANHVSRPHRIVVDGSGRLYVATSAGIYTSGDAGENWVEFNDGFPPYPTGDATVTRNGTLLASTRNDLYRFGRTAILLGKRRRFRRRALRRAPNGASSGDWVQRRPLRR